MCCPTDGYDTSVEPSNTHKRSSQKKTKRYSQKRVSFNPQAVVVATLPKCRAVLKGKLWYRKEELKAFKETAIDLCNKLRTREASGNSVCIRGLERRISLERQRLKNLCIRDVLKAQEEGRSLTYVALVAQEGSSWAVETAKHTGARDYRSVYRPRFIIDENDLLQSLLQDDVNADFSDDEHDKDNDNEGLRENRKRKFDLASETPRKRRAHPKSLSPPRIGWRRPRVAMWQPESWIEARERCSS